MTSQYRHRRISNPSTPFVNALEPGEIAVNTANRQIAVGDANSGSIGAPLALLAIRVFDARAQYAIGDFVIQAGLIYRANAAVSPGAFNATQWDNVTGPGVSQIYVDNADALRLLKAGDTMTGFLTLNADPTGSLHAVTKQYVDGVAGDAGTGLAGKVSKGGDTMTGPLQLPGNPGQPLQAAPKQYVDAQVGQRLAVAGGQNVTGGFSFTPYSLPAGSFALNPFNGNYQSYSNAGAFTITAPAVDCAVDILVTNGAGAGAVTFSGFTVGATGDLLTTTNGNRFIISIRRIVGISTYVIKALAIMRGWRGAPPTHSRLRLLFGPKSTAPECTPVLSETVLTLDRTRSPLLRTSPTHGSTRSSQFRGIPRERGRPTIRRGLKFSSRLVLGARWRGCGYCWGPYDGFATLGWRGCDNGLVPHHQRPPSSPAMKPHPPRALFIMRPYDPVVVAVAPH